MKKILGNRVLARELKEQKTESGLIMADTVESEKTRFEVVGIGDEVEKVTVGDVVRVPSRVGHASHELMVDGEMLFVITESQIVMVETDE